MPNNPEYGAEAGTAEPLPAAWPRGETGAPEPPVFLAKFTNTDLDYTFKLGLLQSSGIPVFSQSGVDNTFANVIFGQSWNDRFGYLLYVPESFLETARELLAAAPIFDEEEGAQ